MGICRLELNMGCEPRRAARAHAARPEPLGSRRGLGMSRLV